MPLQAMLEVIHPLRRTTRVFHTTKAPRIARVPRIARAPLAYSPPRLALKHRAGHRACAPSSRTIVRLRRSTVQARLCRHLTSLRDSLWTIHSSNHQTLRPLISLRHPIRPLPYIRHAPCLLLSLQFTTKTFLPAQSLVYPGIFFWG